MRLTRVRAGATADAAAGLGSDMSKVACVAPSCLQFTSRTYQGSAATSRLELESHVVVA